MVKNALYALSNGTETQAEGNYGTVVGAADTEDLALETKGSYIWG